MKKILFFIAFVLSCETSLAFESWVNNQQYNIVSDLTYKEKIDQLSKLNKISNITDRSDELRGIDLDENGIRDDVDEFIQVNYPKEEHTKAAQQLARGFQQSLLIDMSNIFKAKEVNRLNSLALNCIFLKFDGTDKNAIHAARVASELQSVTTNTKKRLQAYLEFNKALDGTAWSLPVGDTCE